MSSIVIQGDTSGSITVAAPSVAGTHTLTLPKATGNIATDATVGLGMKNRIINGGMVIDQRNAGASITPSSSTYTLDRWQAGMNVASKYSVQQNAGSVTPPAGFKNYLGVTSTSAYTIGATEYCVISHAIEGYNLIDLAWGTANAKSITMSFWVRSSLTGTFGCNLKNENSDRSYPFTYTILSANTWEQKTITIAGETTGTWNTTNGGGLYIQFGLGVGSTRSGTAGSWASTNYTGATGATSVVGTSGATWYVTGVQLEEGENATPFENRMYGTELALCQRYYSLNTPGCGKSTSTTRMAGTVGTPIPMRTTPTVSLFNGTNKAIDIGIALRNVTSIVALEGATIYGGNITADIASSTSGVVHTYMGGCFAWSAEL